MKTENKENISEYAEIEFCEDDAREFAENLTFDEFIKMEAYSGMDEVDDLTYAIAWRYKELCKASYDVFEAVRNGVINDIAWEKYKQWIEEGYLNEEEYLNKK